MFALSKSVSRCARLVASKYPKALSNNKNSFVNIRSMSEKSSKDDDNLGDMGAKYKTFKDEDSEIILDLYEERSKKYESLINEQETAIDPFENISLERGKTGVFEIEELVEVLKRENSEDIFVASVPKEFKYVDYICIVSAKSQRHMQAIAQFVRRVYKKKRDSRIDRIPRLEGENSKDWMALDLGNIALHIFSREARLLYDLDSLWSVGPQFDKEFNKQDPIVEMLEKHSVYLGDLQPAS